MTNIKHPFSFEEDPSNPLTGHVDMEQPLPSETTIGGSGFYRPARLSLQGDGGLDLVLYHNPYTAAFIYLREAVLDRHLVDLLEVPQAAALVGKKVKLPGQLMMGAERTSWIDRATRYLIGAAPLASTVGPRQQENLAVFPIAREGLKYGVAEALHANYGHYCDEILLDAHHVFDSSVPVYNRKVELGIFKDKDLDKGQKDKIRVAFIADSIASGLVMKEVIARISERFEHLQHVEVIAPLTTIRGLCRLAAAPVASQARVRVHVFETLLNALPPDYYYSAHINRPDLHIDPALEQEYRAWWGVDAHGNFIADTACAGYGWSEAFYSPRKQIQMMNSELKTRHGLTIAEILLRNL
jgi:hypothetical protein